MKFRLQSKISFVKYFNIYFYSYMDIKYLKIIKIKK